jgi:hypothetical protein
MARTSLSHGEEGGSTPLRATKIFGNIKILSYICKTNKK